VLPTLCVDTGIIVVAFMICVVAIAIYFSHYMLLSRAEKNYIKTYAELSDIAGGKVLRVILILSILGFLFSSCIGSLIACT